MEAVLKNKNFFQLIIKNENTLYAILNESGILAECDLKQKKWNIWSVLPEWYQSSPCTFFHLDRDSELLYLASQETGRILIYNLKSHQYEEVGFFPEERTEQSYKIAVAVTYQEKFLFLPLYPEMELTVFDKSTKTAQVYFEWTKKFVQYFQDMGLKPLLIRRGSVCTGRDTLYCVVKCESGDVVLSICLSNLKIQEMYRLDIEGKLLCIKSEGEMIWFQNKTAEGSRLICWNSQEERVERKSDLFAGISARVLSIQEFTEFLCVSLADGKMLILEQNTLRMKKIVEDACIYLVENSKVVFTDNGRVVKLLNLKSKEYVEFHRSKDFCTQIFAEMIKEKKKLEVTGERGTGQLIFDKVSA